MTLNGYSIVVINPNDEMPHQIDNYDIIVKYQHGKVEVKSTQKISFGLVFRVVDFSYHYNTLNNVMIHNSDDMPHKDNIQSLHLKAR